MLYKKNLKKILITLTLSFFFIEASIAEPPKFTSSINENSRKLGWVIDGQRMQESEDVLLEIYTMSQSGWIIKCVIEYTSKKAETKYCIVP